MRLTQFINDFLHTAVKILIQLIIGKCGKMFPFTFILPHLRLLVQRIFRLSIYAKHLCMNNFARQFLRFYFFEFCCLMIFSK